MRHMRGQNEHPASGERIAKAIARAGLCSRREAETWIAAGRVAVNGAVIASPARNVTPDDRIAVDGEPLPVRERTRLFLYHKPRGLLTTHADPGGRPAGSGGCQAIDPLGLVVRRRHRTADRAQGLHDLDLPHAGPEV